MTLRLVLATANPDKAAEITAILGPAIELVPRPAEVPDVVEDADTLEANARLKAVAIAEATLEGVDPADRTARFRTVALARWPDGRELVAEGVVDGLIAPVPEGESGFGYDPVFVPNEGDGRTFAEMSADEKHALSHRGRAFRGLLKALGRMT
jgi:XTP/dITP diphosphohydrolase